MPAATYYVYSYLNIVPTVTTCERLILLEADPKELRDYSILLCHCGFYEESLEYLKLYQAKKVRFLISIRTTTYSFDSKSFKVPSFGFFRVVHYGGDRLIH